jgi:hypothetical protein
MAETGSPHAARPRITPQVVIGLAVIAVGVLFTLDNLGLVNADKYFRFWPAALVLVGFLKLRQAIRDGHGWVSGFLFFGIGSWMLINNVTYIRLDSRYIFPLFLVSLGGFLVWRGFGGSPRSRTADAHSHFSSLAVMGASVRRNASQTFAGADLTAVMGGCEADLRQASIAPNTDAVIDVFAFWGGIELKVPEDWTVINRVVPLMGGVDDKTQPPKPAPAAPPKHLILRGLVMMGGIEVKN